MKKDKQINQDGTSPSNDKKSKKRTTSKVVKTAVLSTVIGLCASAIVGLSVALYYAQRTIGTHETYQRQMDAVYSRAYYDLLDGASDLGISLRKISVSNSPKMQQSLLYEVWGCAQLAEDNLGMFKSQDDGILKAQKFVNQLGDYTHALALNIAKGKGLTAEDRQTLAKLGDIADMYKSALEKAGKSLEDSGAFVGDGGMLEQFTSAFEAFSEPSFDYPEMIYDGPFSSALDNRETYGLVGEDISQQQGLEIIKKGFENARNIQFVGQSDGDIVALNYTFEINGENAFAQLSKKGGMLVSFNQSPKEAQNAIKQEASDSCVATAIAFASRFGFENMQTVWSSSSGGECVVNLAPVESGAVIYPDLIKVKIREDDSSVIGFDSSHYAFNHRNRNIAPAGITSDEAMRRLSLEPLSQGRLALIPLRETQEVLTYEFECVQDGTYYVYVDANTGEEVNILYVIEDDMGMRTM